MIPRHPETLRPPIVRKRTAFMKIVVTAFIVKLVGELLYSCL